MWKRPGRFSTGQGFPPLKTPEQAVRAFWHLVSYKQNLELMQEIPPKLPHRWNTNQDKAREIIDPALSREDGSF